ncbi:6-phosphogluconolactonase [compost metagenome]|uniref:6-phosphogluconolactonase n=1 Tax=Pseudomonas linyingensis TaxID=915471 RepID=A0A1H6X201_9PSED|nr:6-phosphogluconolactonase [Pseudomonas linyingensis]SEJ23109.1 6-phosphogluconolactonase [Pseudomonas linyingensis]
MNSPSLYLHPDRDTCAAELAQVLVGRLRADLQDGGRARLLLAGGQSPVPLLGRLAGEALDWSRVELSPTDERWVAADDVASNLQLLRTALPQAQLLDPRLGATPEEAAQAWGERLAGWLPLTAVLLGMGEDGHIASLFPGMPGIASALTEDASPAALVGVAPVAPQVRLSANLALLRRSGWLGLLVFGGAKRELLEAVLADRPDTRQLPVHALVRQAGSRLQVHWAP